MFGLESESFESGGTSTLFPSASPGFGWDHHSTEQQQSSAVNAASHEEFGHHPVPDFAFMDDTLSMWENAPASFQ